MLVDGCYPVLSSYCLHVLFGLDDLLCMYSLLRCSEGSIVICHHLITTINVSIVVGDEGVLCKLGE